jgi:hypothetical protein
MSSRPVVGGRAQTSNLQTTASAHATSGADGTGTQLGAEVQLPDGQLTAARDAPLGGQAVLEGVMMRGVRHWAVAVRKPLLAVSLAQGESGVHDDGTRDMSHALEVALAREGELGREEQDGQLEPLGEIEVTMSPLSSALARHRWLRVPVLRGIVALGGSLAIGFKALGISANAQLPEGEAEEDPQEISSAV